MSSAAAWDLGWTHQEGEAQATHFPEPPDPSRVAAPEREIEGPALRDACLILRTVSVRTLLPVFLKRSQAQSEWIYTHRTKQLEMASLDQGPGSPHRTLLTHPSPSRGQTPLAQCFQSTDDF